MYQLAITDEFRKTVTGAFGEDGARWLSRLPQLVEECASRWGLTVLDPYPLSYNFVAPVVRAGGSPAVLKIGCPNPEFDTEVASLAAFDGDGVCRLYEYAPDLSAMLIERVEPGEPLTRLAMEDDAAATDVAVSLFRSLWRTPPAGHSFPTVERRFRSLRRHRERFGGSGPLPETLFEEAEEALAWLLDSNPEPMLLHDDCHHDNILSATRQPWLIIDPKGTVGDPGYDLGAFLSNPRPGLLLHPAPARVIADRVDRFADGLDMDRSRVRGWGLAHAVLSACWSIEDGQDWHHAITCAGYLAGL